MGGKLLQVVVPPANHVVRLRPPLASEGKEQVLAIVKRHDGVISAVYDQHWAFNVGSPIDVDELVEAHAVAERDDNTKHTT